VGRTTPVSAGEENVRNGEEKGKEERGENHESLLCSFILPANLVAARMSLCTAAWLEATRGRRKASQCLLKDCKKRPTLPLPNFDSFSSSVVKCAVGPVGSARAFDFPIFCHRMSPDSAQWQTVSAGAEVRVQKEFHKTMKSCSPIISSHLLLLIKLPLLPLNSIALSAKIILELRTISKKTRPL